MRADDSLPAQTPATSHLSEPSHPDAANASSRLDHIYASTPLESANQSSKGRFSTHVAWTLAARLVMLACSLGAGIIVARWLGAEGLGALAVLNVAVAIGVQVGCAGLPSASTYFIAQDRTSLAQVWANALLFSLAAGSFLAVALVALARSRPELFGDIPFFLILVAAVSVPFQLVTFLGLNALLGVGRVAQFNLVETISQLLLLAGAALMVVLLGEGLRVLVSFNTAASFMIALLVTLSIGRTIAREKGAAKFRPHAELFKRMMRYGLKFHVSVVAMLLIVRADLLVVNHFRGATEAGVYAVAAQIANLLLLLPGVIATLLFPRIVSGGDGRGELTMRATRHTTFIMLVICLASVPLAFALPLLYGEAFTDAPVQLLILLPGIFLMSIEAVLVQHFNSLGVPRAIPLIWVLTLAVNLILNLILVPRYGARGAAASSTISYAMVFLLIGVYFLRQTGNKLSQTFVLGAGELRDLLKMFRAGAVKRQEA